MSHTSTQPLISGSPPRKGPPPMPTPAGSPDGRDGDRLIDANEFARILKISRAAFFRAKAAGKIPDPLKISGRLIRWLISEVEAWLRHHMPSADEWNLIRPSLGFGPRGTK